MSSKARQRQKRKGKRRQEAIDEVERIIKEQKRKADFFLNSYNEYGRPCRKGKCITDPTPADAQYEAGMKGIWGERYLG